MPAYIKVSRVIQGAIIEEQRSGVPRGRGEEE